MACKPEILSEVPLFSLLDPEERALLAAQVDLTSFAARQRIYRRGDPGGTAYVLLTGSVQVTTLDDDNQSVIVDEPNPGDFFGFASMFGETPHQTDAVAIEDSVCIEIDRNDISLLIHTKPHAGLDLLTVLSRQFHAAQELVRIRAARNPNELIEEESTFGEHVADAVARFGGSWSFIISFGVVLAIYTAINVFLGHGAWDPYPFILLNLFLSMLAALQAPVIMMSQNRQDTKDRLRGELDFDVNRRAEAEIKDLALKIQRLTDKVADVEDLLGERR